MARAFRDSRPGATAPAGEEGHDGPAPRRGDRDSATGLRMSSRSAGGRATSARATAADEPGMLGGVPHDQRLQMELVARASRTPDDALDQVLSILLGGTGERHAAVAGAFRANDALREQWERTWEILRS